MLNQRINDCSEESGILSQAQFAYKKGYSTTDAIFVLNTTLAFCIETLKQSCCGFINFSKASDKIDREIKSQTIIDMHVLKHVHVSQNHMFELYDSLIKPIPIYGCVVWGAGYYNDIETYQYKFMKRTLGVKGSTNTCLLYILGVTMTLFRAHGCVSWSNQSLDREE